MILLRARDISEAKAVIRKIKPATWGRLLALAGVAAIAVALLPMMSRAEAQRFIQHAGEMGVAGAALVVGLYAGWCLLGLPASIVTLAAAVVFGFWRGLLVVYLGANLGATLAFLVARYVARDWVTRKVSHRPIFNQINRAVGESGWKIVLLTRLPPISPFSIINFVYGLTPVSYGAYAFGTAIGMIPGTTAYVYLGTLLSNQLQGPDHAPVDALRQKIYVGGFIVTIAVCIYIVRLAKAALNRHAIGGES